MKTLKNSQIVVILDLCGSRWSESDFDNIGNSDYLYSTRCITYVIDALNMCRSLYPDSCRLYYEDHKIISRGESDLSYWGYEFCTQLIESAHRYAMISGVNAHINGIDLSVDRAIQIMILMPFLLNKGI